MPTGLIDEKSTLLGAVSEQALIWPDADSDLCHYIASKGHTELPDRMQHLFRE